jgi:hypothetical protein
MYHTKLTLTLNVYIYHSVHCNPISTILATNAHNFHVIQNIISKTLKF